MNKSICFFIIIQFFTMVCNLYAEEKKETAQGDVSVLSHYVWRGQRLSKEAVVQPSIGINYGNFGANLWATYDMDTEEHNETDLTLNYMLSMDKVSLDAGYIYYAVDGPGSVETQEVYLSVSYEVLLNPAFSVYFDFDEGDGTFINTSLGYNFKLPKGITVNLGANAGYNIKNKTMGRDKNGDTFSYFYNGELSTSMIIPWESITVAPVIAYTFPLSNKGKEAIEGISYAADDKVVYGGITVSLSI